MQQIGTARSSNSNLPDPPLATCPGVVR